MDFGISLGEVFLVLVLGLVFFGSKGLPGILRDLGKGMAWIRARSNEMMVELQQAGQPVMLAKDETRAVKAMLRKKHKGDRKKLTGDEIRDKSDRIMQTLMQTPLWTKARSVLIYLALPEEVQTDDLIRHALKDGKKVAVPYIAKSMMEISALTDLDHDLVPGTYAIREPKPEKIRRFFKSDLELAVCPGVAFDTNGGRLGFGKGYFDYFLREIQGRIPVVGLAFDRQILPDPLPFSYNDVPMDQVFTESRVISSRVG